MSVWIVRHGVSGEHEEWALTHSRAAVGFDAVGDLSAATTKEKVRAAVNVAYPADPLGRQSNYSDQLWAVRGVIKPGDLVIMPMKKTRKLALGICTSGYQRVLLHRARAALRADLAMYLSTA